ncbi:MAG: asparagine synthase (glutamine-hydrolyzing) [Bdellovibrionales bacterium]|nr:asparagine synthase (glutamine-hydrolyzing) [Bdellovibrionales bacterium]
MCGIVGFYSKKHSQEERTAIVRAAAARIASRGPDDSGTWVNADGLALGHRRLSILDLSPLGHQPMISPRTGNVLVYNGEVYNFAEIRSELESRGLHFRSTGDTEVLLAAIDEWGLEETLKKANGMFALAVWIAKDRVLQIARDRIGIKPLYYGWLKSGFVFASELKALFELEDFCLPLSSTATSIFFELGYITAPYSIFEDIFKLLPGTTLTLREVELSRTPDGFSPFKNSSARSPQSYWEVPKVHEGRPKNFEEAKEQLEHLIADSVALRSIADVPLGAFLSGGIDSSVVSAIMKANNSGSVKTFSIGFEEKGYNEAPYAKAIAEHLGTDHTELYLPADEALKLIPDLPLYFDEPFADSSQVPTTLLSRLTREHVTVSLSGDGGDELFCGYTRHPIAVNIWNSVKFLPGPIRNLLASGIRVLPMRTWAQIYDLLQPIFPRSLREMKYVGLKAHRLAEVLSSRSLGELYCTANTHWRPQYHPVPFQSARSVLTNYQLEKEFTEVYHYLTYLDLNTYLPDDILTKVDRASMSCALEARVPLLDHRIVEFSRSLPPEWCIHRGTQKVILRDVLQKYVPKQLFERPKKGFGIPIHQWLREDLREWGESLLSEEALPKDGLLNRQVIMEKWSQHQRNELQFHYPLWDVLQFQAWRKRWGSAISHE